MKILKAVSCFALAASFCLPATLLRAQADDTIDVQTLEELRGLPPETIASWEKYDGRKYGIVTSVKSQIPTQLCWSYGSLAAIETSMLREGLGSFTAENLDLDEIEAAKATCGKFLDPLSLADGSNLAPSKSSWDRGGYTDFIARISSHWQGVMRQGNAETQAPRDYSEFILQNAIKCNNDVGEIKYLVAKYGAVAFEYANGYNEYHIARSTVDHASVIVGWDDTVKKENFVDYSTGQVLAKQDGAYLVKNSWGTERNNGGYLWLSYDSLLSDITAFDMDLRDDSALLYNYAGKDTSRYFWRSTPKQAQKSYSYVFTPKAKAKETLSSVMVGVEGRDVQVKIDVYSDVTSSSPASTTVFDTKSTLQSVCTVPLSEPVEIEEGKDFCVVVTVLNGGFLLDFNANTGNARCYELSGSAWGKCTLNDGMLPVIHPITKVEDENTYDASLRAKMQAFDGAVKEMGDGGASAQNYEELTSLKTVLSGLSSADRESLTLPDSIRISRYERYLEQWSSLQKNAQRAIDLGKKFLG